MTLPLWPRASVGRSAGEAGSGTGADLVATARRPAVWLNVAVFLLYTGLEATAAQWLYSLFTESRGVAPAVAGTWASLYWGSLTLGRVIVGVAANRFAAPTVLRVAMTLAPLAAALIAVGGVTLVVPAGVGLLSFALAPIYPMLIVETPVRLGRAVTRHAVGLQVAAACVGAAGLPGTAGVVAAVFGLEALGPFIVGLALALAALHEIGGPLVRPGAGRAARPA